MIRKKIFNHSAFLKPWFLLCFFNLKNHAEGKTLKQNDSSPNLKNYNKAKVLLKLEYLLKLMCESSHGSV